MWQDYSSLDKAMIQAISYYYRPESEYWRGLLKSDFIAPMFISAEKRHKA